jgi:hypothetical protein
MRTRQVAYWLVALCGINAVAAGRANLTSIRGHVVAIRPAERLGQVVSGVVNRETFLLRVDGKAGEIVKVVYEVQPPRGMRGWHLKCEEIARVTGTMGNSSPKRPS